MLYNVPPWFSFSGYGAWLQSRFFDYLLLNESGLFDKDAIERQLAHQEGNKVRPAYHRSEYLTERRRMMQWWSDYLEKLRTH